MIPVYPASVDPKAIVPDEKTPSSWQKQLSQAFRSSHDLLRYLEIDPDGLEESVLDPHNFPVRVPLFFADLMKKGDLNDPLLLQVLAKTEENLERENFIEDPLDEASFTATAGLIHKYKNRVLLVAHQSCAVHCRYCFRRHFPYSDQRLSSENRDTALDYIRNNQDINEVILSGGDPLNLADQKLTEWLDRLEQIEHVKTVRLHTRTPVVLPDRLTNELIDLLSRSTKSIVIVFHINHGQEISELFTQQIKKLKRSGATLLNQSVLLKGVNDRVDTLVELSQKLWSVGILPYYLHLLDNVAGAAHFRVEPATAEMLWRELQREVSGYLLPRLVQEIPHRPSKTWINPIYHG